MIYLLLQHVVQLSYILPCFSFFVHSFSFILFNLILFFKGGFVLLSALFIFTFWHFYLQIQEYESKLKDLKSVTKDLYGRVNEMLERPAAIEALNSMLNHSTYFMVGMKNFTGEDQPFTQVEYDALEKLITETKVCLFISPFLYYIIKSTHIMKEF